MPKPTMQPRIQSIPTQPSKLPKNTPKNTRETSKKDSCFTANIQNFFFWKYFPKKILHLDRFLISTRLFPKNHQTHTAQEAQKKILTNTKTPHFSLATKQNTSALRGTRAEERIPERETYRKHLGPRNNHQPNHRTNSNSPTNPLNTKHNTERKQRSPNSGEQNRPWEQNRPGADRKNRGLKKSGGIMVSTSRAVIGVGHPAGQQINLGRGGG